MGRICDIYADLGGRPRYSAAQATPRGCGAVYSGARGELGGGLEHDPHTAGRARGRRPAAVGRAADTRDRAAPRAVPVVAAGAVHDPHAAHGGRAAHPGPARDRARNHRSLRRPPAAAAGGPGGGGGPLGVAAARGPAGRRLGAFAARAALGARGGAAIAGRRADGGPGGRARPRRPPHLRALVHARRAPLAPALPRRGPRAVRPPAAAGPGLHHRGRRAAPRLRPGKDAAAARPQLSRTHRGRDAPVVEPPGSPGAADAAVPQAAALAAGDRVVTAQGSSAPKPPPQTVLIVDDEAPLRRGLERSLAGAGHPVAPAGRRQDAYRLLATRSLA